MTEQEHWVKRYSYKYEELRLWLSPFAPNPRELNWMSGPKMECFCLGVPHQPIRTWRSFFLSLQMFCLGNTVYPLSQSSTAKPMVGSRLMGSEVEHECSRREKHCICSLGGGGVSIIRSDPCYLHPTCASHPVVNPWILLVPA